MPHKNPAIIGAFHGSNDNFFGKVPIKIIDFMKTMATNAAKGPIRSKPNITSDNSKLIFSSKRGGLLFQFYMLHNLL